MGWIESESVWFFCPGFADKFEWREALQCLEPSGEVIGVDEVREVAAKLVMVIIVIPFDGCLFDGSIHAFYLSIGPWVLWFGQTVFDFMSPTGAVEWMAAIAGCGSIPVLWQISELNTVISQDCVDVVGDSFGQGVLEGCGGHCIGAIVDLDISELRCPIDGDIKVEFACGCADFRQVDMEVANPLSRMLRIGCRAAG